MQESAGVQRVRIDVNNDLMLVTVAGQHCRWRGHFSHPVHDRSLRLL
jgi:hypothetical protein